MDPTTRTAADWEATWASWTEEMEAALTAQERTFGERPIDTAAAVAARVRVARAEGALHALSGGELFRAAARGEG